MDFPLDGEFGEPPADFEDWKNLNVFYRRGH